MTPEHTTKHIVIQILIQDMKRQQLIIGLNKLGFQSNIHGSDLCAVVAELMGIHSEEISWEWFDCYMDFLGHAGDYQVTGDGKNLLPLAEICYVNLSICAERDRNMKRNQ
jgi:hypothetical protein